MDAADQGAPVPTSGNRDWHGSMGVGVVCGFAAMWAWMGAGAIHHGTMVIRVAAIFISVTLLAARVSTNMKDRTGPVDRILLRFTVVGEVVALWVMGLALGHWNRPDLLLPGLAIIVGIHFFPMAKAVRIPAYRITAAAMTVVGIGALTMPEPSRTALLGLGCASILWLTTALPLWGPRR